jgi:biotin/methionine sulfoxide reductase
MNNFVSTHWGTYETSKKNEKNIKINKWSKDPNPSDFGLGFLESATDDLRINQPHIRKEWLKDRDNRKNLRGLDEFVPVSWKEAIDITAAELKNIKNNFGNSSIYAGSYGWASAGRFHHAKSQLNRFFNLFGGFSSSLQSYSYAAAQTLLPHIVGHDLYSFLDEHNTWNTLEKECDLIVMFGGMPLKNSQVSAGGVGKHTTEIALRKCVESGTKFINISPNANDSAKFLKAKQISIIPNTDTALMLSLAYILIVSDKYDQKFIEDYTSGFNEFKSYVLGENNNQPCTPEWASNITSIPVETIKWLGKKISKNKTMISISWSLQRASAGEQPLWMGITLASMLGHIGTEGGGIGFGYSSVNSTGDVFKKIPWKSLPQGKNKIKDFIPVARITDMLEKPNELFQYDGKKLKYPNIKLIYWAGGNPFHHHQDLNRLVKAWQRPKTIIVNEIWWNAQARHADIILPANTALERNDIMLNPRDPTIVANKKTISSIGESKSDFEIFSCLADKLGFKNSFTENKSELDWLKYLWNESKKVSEEMNLKLPEFDKFWEDGFFEVPIKKTKKIMFKEFRDNPKINALNTPSGKIEITSNTIKNYNLKDCKGYPTWIEPYEWLGRKENFPLHLISNQPEYRLHGQLDNAEYSLKNKIKDREPVLINIEDAKERNIENNDIVLIFNKRGRVLAGARLSNQIMRGVLVLSTGAWFDPDYKINTDLHGNPNVLTRDIGASQLSQAPTSHTCLVEIRKARQNEIKQVKIFLKPKIQKKLVQKY